MVRPKLLFWLNADSHTHIVTQTGHARTPRLRTAWLIKEVIAVRCQAGGYLPSQKESSPHFVSLWLVTEAQWCEQVAEGFTQQCSLAERIDRTRVIYNASPTLCVTYKYIAVTAIPCVSTRNSAIADKPCDAFRGQSRSPNTVPFDMLGMVSYYRAIVTLSLRHMRDIRLQKCCDLENWVKDPCRSLKFDRAHYNFLLTFYSS